MAHFSLEIYENILNHLVADSSLGDEFDDRVTPFHEFLPPYPPDRTKLATACTLVCSAFYDLATPIAWRYLVVRDEEDLDILLRSAQGNKLRKTRQPIGRYTRRIDLRAWRDVCISKSMDLLSMLPNVEVLALESRTHPGPVWRHPLNDYFYRLLPSMCTNLRRLQFLQPRECPTLKELAFLSRECKELRSIHIVHLTESYGRFTDFPSRSTESVEGSEVSAVEGGGVEGFDTQAETIEDSQQDEIGSAENSTGHQSNEENECGEVRDILVSGSAQLQGYQELNEFDSEEACDGSCWAYSEEDAEEYDGRHIDAYTISGCGGSSEDNSTEQNDQGSGQEEEQSHWSGSQGNSEVEEWPVDGESVDAGQNGGRRLAVATHAHTNEPNPVLDELDSVSSDETKGVASIVARYPTAIWTAMYSALRSNHQVADEDQEETNVDPRSFGFHKLERLALGMGNIHGSISERRSISLLVEAMGPHRPAMSALRRVDAYLSLEGLVDDLLPFRDIVERSVLHMFWQSRPAAYPLYPNIKRILIVVHTTYISIPLGMVHLEELEILLRRPAFINDMTSASITNRMVATAKAMLEALLEDLYPNLKKVVVWKGAVMHHIAVDALVSQYVDRFLAMGVALETKCREVAFQVPEWYPPSREPSAQLI